MRALLDWLARFIEPYVSFRFLIALVFSALFVYDVTSTVLTLRDFTSASSSAEKREAQVGRILKQFAFLLVLRACSWSTVQRNAGLLCQIAVLLAAAVAINLYVYSPAH